MCAIVLTKDMGFIRIYPIPADMEFSVWGMIEMEIERGSDNRDESYKLTAFTVSGKVEANEDKREILNRCVIKSGNEDPQEFQNKRRKSIYIAKPVWGDMEVTLSQKVPDVSPDDEECGWLITQGKHWLKPYVKWTSDQGKDHTTHLGGREIYMGIARNPQQPWELMNNIQITNPDYEHWMLMGNMKDKRNVWLCVHLHRLKKQIGGSTPLFSHPIVGDVSAWPYNEQEDSNVEIVDGHPMLFTMKNMNSRNSLGNTTLAK